MKTYALKPSEDNLIKTFVKDSIGRATDVSSFVILLQNLEAPCSISIDGSWGTGKTFFVKQCKLILDSLNPNSAYSKTDNAVRIIEKYKNCFDNSGNQEVNDIPIVTAYYDAWEHDDENDPLLSLMYEIMKDNLDSYPCIKQKNWSEILASLAGILSDRDIPEFVKSLHGKNIFDKQIEKENIDKNISDFLNSFLPEQGNKLVIFVDELDRCSPKFAVKLLERIKHYFSQNDVIFVFSTNTMELQNTIKKFYGDGFDSCRYLDRFFDFRTEIPAVDTEKFFASIGMQGNRDLSETVSFEVIRQMNMSMREISRFIIIVKALANRYSEKNRKYGSFDNGMADLLGYCVVLPILFGLKMTRPEEYEKFISGRDYSWLEKIIMTERLESWIMGLLLPDENELTIEDTLNTKKERIKKLYEAIFVEQYTGKTYQITVGKAVFEKGFKDSIIKAMGLISPLTDYSI